MVQIWASSDRKGSEGTKGTITKFQEGVTLIMTLYLTGQQCGEQFRVNEALTFLTKWKLDPLIFQLPVQCLNCPAPAALTLLFLMTWVR